MPPRKPKKKFQPGRRIDGNAFGFNDRPSKKSPPTPESEQDALDRELEQIIAASSIKDDPVATSVSSDPDAPDKLSATKNVYEALSAAASGSTTDGDILDPVQLMDLAISANLDPSIFTAQSFPVAPNIIEWCRGAKFLGYGGELWPRQIQILSRFFGDVCYFCSDTDYVHNVPADAYTGDVLDRFVFMQYGVCPKCKRNRTEMLQDWSIDSRFAHYNEFEPHVDIPPVPPNEFVGVWGQRAGKSYTTATFAWPYILHRYLALPNPPRYFNRPKNIILEAAFVAPTIHQVEENIWMPFREIYDTSPWFKEVRQYLIDEGKKVGIPLYHAAQRFVLFPGKRIALHIRAANTTNLRGATRIFVTLDELGWFNHTEEGKRRTNVKDGTEVFNSLANSLVTIRTQANKRRKNLKDYDTLDAYMFNISSPSSASDAIMQRKAVANQMPRMYATHFPTWEVNPEEDEETIKEQKAGDPVSFQRDFKAIPPRAMSPYFEDGGLLRQLEIEDSGPGLFTYEIDKVTDTRNFPLLRPVIREVRPDLFSSRILTIDNGESDNSFGLCIARYDPETEGIIYEEFLEVAPHQGYRVDLAWCYNDVILPLIQAFDFTHVVFDRWNSAHQVLDLRTNYNVRADRYTLKWADFQALLEDLRGMKVRFPQAEVDPDSLLDERDIALRSSYPRAHCQLQFTTVEQFGRKLHKPDNGSDDLFRVAALAYAYMRKNKDIYRKGALRRRAGAGESRVGIFRGASRGASGTRNPNRKASRTGVSRVGGGRSAGAFYNRGVQPR